MRTFQLATLLLGCSLLWPPAAATAQTDALEIDAGVLGYVSRRNATFEGQVGKGSGTMAGVEIHVRSRLVGAAARFFGGGFRADSGFEALGEIDSGDLQMFVGPNVIAGELGYALRSYTGAFGTRRWSFIRLGAHSSIPIGASGLVAMIGATVYTGVSGPSSSGSGKEFSTRLSYSLPQAPFYLAIGYRFEQFTVEDSADVRPEEVSGILIAAGVRIGQLFGL